MKQLNQKLLMEVIQLYKIDPDSLENLDGNESFVYSYCSDDKEYILKIIHDNHRSHEEVNAEADWLHFLSQSNVPVSVPIHSKNGIFVEKFIDGNSYYSIIAFHKAIGRLLDQKDFTPQIIQNWGACMGKIHRVSKVYSPPHTSQRKHWFENKYLKTITSNHPTFKKKYEQIKKHIISLPSNSNHYGLIHSDFHHQNFLMKDNSLTVIDFDDAEYSWFINDIAKTLYNETFNFSISPKDRNDFANFFITEFLTGYESENLFDYLWIDYFQSFLELRHLFIMNRKYSTLNETEKENLVQVYESQLKKNNSLLNIDFSFRLC
ncbi:phosphotransferase enzyme family protein [Bacillus sp. AK128]